MYVGDQCGASFIENNADKEPFNDLLQQAMALPDKVLMSQWLKEFDGKYLEEEPTVFIDDFSYWPTADDLDSRCV